MEKSIEVQLNRQLPQQARIVMLTFRYQPARL